MSEFMMRFNPVSNLRCALVLVMGLLLGGYATVPALAAGPYFATGIKIGEVTDQNAIVWTRLTKHAERNAADGPLVEIVYDQPEGKGSGRRTRAVEKIVFPDGCTVNDLREGAPGVDGDVRVLWKAAGDSEWQETDWQAVDPLRDFTRQFALSQLRPATSYELRVESRGVDGKPGAVEEGHFRTAQVASDPQRVVFVAATCFGNDDQDSPEGFKIYRAISALAPNFFVHTGDIIYYDELAKTVDLARWHWQRMYSWPSNVAFHRGIASYFMKDDHDTWYNDCWPTLQSRFMGDFTFRQGQAVFREQVPIGELPYRTFRWGRDLQIWLVEGRDFRSPNNQPDGPEKTIWGEEQKRWFEKSVEASDATFRVLISPTPLVGPDRNAKNDNLANRGFEHEGGQLRDFVAAHKMLTICGDRHWQFMSVDPRTKAREYSSGPGSDPHAGGWDEKDYRPEIHRFLRVAGGFLSMTVERIENKPTLTARFHDVEGHVKFTDVVPAP
jgi:alkaline phosphatase D